MSDIRIDPVFSPRTVPQTAPGVPSTIEIYQKTIDQVDRAANVDPRVIPKTTEGVPGTTSVEVWNRDDSKRYDDAVRSFDNMLRNADDPVDEENKIQTSRLFAEMTGKDFSFVYNNLDKFSQAAMAQDEPTPFHTAIANGFKGAVMEIEMSDLWNDYYYAAQQGDEQRMEDIRKRSRELEESMPPQANFDGEWYEKFFKQGVVGFAQQIPRWTVSAVRGVPEAAANLAAAGAGVAVGTALTAATGIGTPVVAIGGTALALYSLRVGAAQQYRQISRGLQYKEFLDYNVRDDVAWATADVIAGVESIIEMIQFDGVTAAFTGRLKREVLEAAATEGMEKAVKSNAMNRVIRAFGGYVKDVAGEVVEEDLQEVSKIIGENIAYSIHNKMVETGEIDADEINTVSGQEAFDRLLDTTVQSVSTMMVTMAASRGMGVAAGQAQNALQRRVQGATETRIRAEEAQATGTGTEVSDQVFERAEDTRTVPVENIAPRTEDITPEQRAEAEEILRATETGQRIQPIEVVETAPGEYRVARGNAQYLALLDRDIPNAEVRVVESVSPVETAQQSRQMAQEARPQYTETVNRIASETGGAVRIEPMRPVDVEGVAVGRQTALSSSLIYETPAQVDAAVEEITDTTTSWEITPTEAGTNIRFSLDNGYVAEVNVMTEAQFAGETRIAPAVDALVEVNAADGTMMAAVNTYRQRGNIEPLREIVSNLRTDETVSPEVQQAAQAVYDEIQRPQRPIIDSLRPQEVGPAAEAAPVVQPWQQTAEEYSRAQRPIQRVVTERRAELSEQTLRDQMTENFPQWSQEEQDAAVAVAQRIASYRGQDLDTWLRENLQAEVFARDPETAQRLREARAKAAVTFGEDAKAIIELGDNADFTSWVHEIGHVLRRNLSPEDKAAVEAEIGVKDGKWTVADEEKFVRMLEDHLKNNTHAGTVFDKIAEWFREMYFALRDAIDVPPEVARLFDEIFAEDRFGEPEAEVAEAPLELFQKAPPVESEAFQEWFGDSKVVNEDGSPKVLYHGTLSEEIEAFSRDLIGERFQYSFGFHFTTSKGEAEVYAGKKGFKALPKDQQGEVHSLYAKAENPLVIETTQPAASMEADLNRAIIIKQVVDSRKTDSPYDSVIIKAETGDKYDHWNVIVFEPTQIKSTENTGTFDPKDPRILFQPDETHEDIVRDAVERELGVPDHVLAEYADRDWALEEISRRETMKRFSDLVQEAKEVESPKELRAYAESLGDVPEDMTDAELDKFYEEVFARSNRPTVEESIQEWEKSIASDDGIMGIIGEYAKDKDMIFASNPAATVKIAVNNVLAGRKTSPTTIQKIRKTFKKERLRYEELLALTEGDQATIERINYERAIAEADGAPIEEQLAAMTISNRMKLARTTTDTALKNKILKGNVTLKGLNELDRGYQKDVDDLQKKVSDLEEDIDLKIAGLQRKNKKISDLESEVKELERKIKSERITKKETKDKLRKKKNDKIKQLEAEIKDFAKSAREEARAEVESARKELKEAQKRKEDLRRVRQYKEQLAKRINKPVSKNTEYAYKVQIRKLQELVDGEFRRIDTGLGKLADKATKEYDLSFFRDPENAELSPEAKDVMENIRRNLDRKNLNQWTLRELEELNTQIRQLREAGRAVYAYRKEVRKLKLNHKTNKMVDELTTGKPFEMPKDKTSEEAKKAEKSNPWIWQAAQFFSPTRMIRLMTGIEGDMYDVFWKQVNKTTDEWFRWRNQRIKAGEDKFKELGLSGGFYRKNGGGFGFKENNIYRKLKGVSREIQADGTVVEKEETHTVEEAMYMYIAAKNEKARDAVMYGAGVEDYMQYVNQLSPKEKAMADYIIDDFAKRYDAYREAAIKDTGEDIGKEPFYIPIVRIGISELEHDMTLAERMAAQQGYRKAYAERGATRKRQKISAANQGKIRMDLMSIWREQVDRHEFYISNFQQIKDMQYMLNQGGLLNALRYTKGKSAEKWARDYVNGLANPNIFKLYDELSQFGQLLRNNFAVAFLAGNFTTVLKQVPSLALYASRAGGMLPGTVAIAQSAAQFRGKKTFDFIAKRDPQWESRSAGRYLAELTQGRGKTKFARARDARNRFMMAGIQYSDKVVTAIGWMAVYNAHKNVVGEEEAIRLAQEATLETQPVSGVKDLPRILKTNGMFSFMTMFSTQTTQLYNMLVGDIPNNVKAGMIKRAIGTITAMSVANTAMVALSGWRPDTDDGAGEILKDFALQKLMQWIGIIPVIGKDISQGIAGYSGGADPFPAAGAIGQVFGDLLKTKSLSDKKLEDAIEGVGVLVGEPVLFDQRLIDAIMTTSEDGPLEGFFEMFGSTLDEESIIRNIPEVAEAIKEDLE